jgi:hypothetical protein
MSLLLPSLGFSLSSWAYVTIVSEIRYGRFLPYTYTFQVIIHKLSYHSKLHTYKASLYIYIYQISTVNQLTHHFVSIYIRNPNPNSGYTFSLAGAESSKNIRILTLESLGISLQLQILPRKIYFCLFHSFLCIWTCSSFKLFHCLTAFILFNFIINVSIRFASNRPYRYVCTLYFNLLQRCCRSVIHFLRHFSITRMSESEW